ncbi:capsular exopolysaccharide family [Thalassoporum mexicanum PCC 7367]|uniref:GumC family protein n=1 Tax=Thalassoporum mexicanum TaxID=3457544 RepID=UPI00029FB3C5|nr:tyrosine-protein kinase domain-containing protein [Pseudanabaena sp. PCC 7367]AFY71621.1 capsular exopolysaccharide family [Pseudanabaena sp. PCC 7367]
MNGKPDYPIKVEEGGLDLNRSFQALKRRAVLIICLSGFFAGAAVFKALSKDTSYRAEFEVLVQSATPESNIVSTITDETNPNASAAEEIDFTTIRVLTSPSVMTPIVEEIRQTYAGLSYSSLANRLNVDHISGSKDILRVSYRSRNPEEVVFVLETIAQSYLDYSLQVNKRDVDQGSAFIEAQLPVLRQRTELLQEQLQELRQEFNFIDPTEEGQLLSDQTGDFRKQQLEAELELNVARSLLADLNFQLANAAADSIVIADLSDNDRYDKILDELLAVKLQTAQETVRFVPGSPNIDTLDVERNNLQPILRQEAELVRDEIANKILALESRNAYLDQAIETLNQKIRQLSQVDRQYTNITNELEIATNNLNQFLTAREALKIDSAQRQIPWQILTPPTDPEPVGKGIARNLVVGLMFGMLLGTGIALLLDRLTDVLYTAEEVKSITGFPLLGMIPAEATLEQQPKSLNGSRLANQFHQLAGRRSGELDQNQHYVSSSFFEAFRSLYASLLLLNPDEPIQSIVITSTAIGDGKSMFSAYLGQAAAAMGRRVVIVDTDMRQAYLYTDGNGFVNSNMDSGMAITPSKQKGLTDIISANLKVAPLLQRSSLEENLYVLAAGTANSPDPTRLLASQKMEALMAYLESKFDLVIYDAPPLSFADAYLLAPRTEGILMVTSLGKQKRSGLEEALEKLRISGVPVLGIVANRSSKLTADSLGAETDHRLLADHNADQNSNMEF